MGCATKRCKCRKNKEAMIPDEIRDEISEQEENTEGYEDSESGDDSEDDIDNILEEVLGIPL